MQEVSLAIASARFQAEALVMRARVALEATAPHAMALDGYNSTITKGPFREAPGLIIASGAAHRPAAVPEPTPHRPRRPTWRSWSRRRFSGSFFGQLRAPISFTATITDTLGNPRSGVDAALDRVSLGAGRHREPGRPGHGGLGAAVSSTSASAPPRKTSPGARSCGCCRARWGSSTSPVAAPTSSCSSRIFSTIWTRPSSPPVPGCSPVRRRSGGRLIILSTDSAAELRPVPDEPRRHRTRSSHHRRSRQPVPRHPFTHQRGVLQPPGAGRDRDPDLEDAYRRERPDPDHHGTQDKILPAISPDGQRLAWVETSTPASNDEIMSRGPYPAPIRSG